MSNAPTAVRITVPATSANLGPGFDALGLALDWHDAVEVDVTSGGLNVSVSVSGEGADDVPRDEHHLVVRAMFTTFEAMGAAPPGLGVRCANAIPHGRGLGSSAAAIVAGVLAARALLPAVLTGRAAGRADQTVRDTPPLEERSPDLEALAIAAEIEGHPDNVAPCLLGGATVAWTSDGVVRAERLDVHPDIRPVVYVPEVAVPTEAARGLLPETVPFDDAARNAGRAALLVEALANRPDLLFDATQDWLHQEYRRSAMPESLSLVESLRADGWAAVVSGAGPSVLLLSVGESSAPTVAGWDVRRLEADRRGATVVPVRKENPHEGYDPVAIGHED